ncbi:MAG: hypothetical protein R2864_10530 [Syntrophotaleaceae bacterium]
MPGLALRTAITVGEVLRVMWVLLGLGVKENADRLAGSHGQLRVESREGRQRDDALFLEIDGAGQDPIAAQGHLAVDDEGDVLLRPAPA